MSNIVFSMILNNTDFVKKMNLSRAEVRNLERQVNKTTGSLSKMVKGGLAPMIGPLMGFAGGAAVVGGALARATEKMIALDSAMAEMKALLGATEAQMERFKIAAIGMASASTVAADEVIRAMIKVGGAMPQLLDFEDGLKSVTQSAITLSEASGMTLEDSINSLTSMMNQFGAAAMDSDRYINVLAAASQAGSAEIDYLSEAIAKSGGAATSANMEFEELVSLIEAVAPKFGKAEEAGTALRGVLLKMETGGKETKISTQGLAKALDNLAKMGTQEMLKKFGVEGYNMAKAMVDARDSFAKFNGEVRGTNAAQEQAEIRTNNLKGAVEQLANRWDAFTLSLNNSAGPLTNIVNLLSSAIEKLALLNPSYNEFLEKQKYANTERAKKYAPQIIGEFKSRGLSDEQATDKAIEEIGRRIAEKQTLSKNLAKNIPAIPSANMSDLSLTDISAGLSASMFARIISGAQSVKSVTDPEGLEKQRKESMSKFEQNENELDYLGKVLAFLKDKKSTFSTVNVAGGGGGGKGTSSKSDPLAAVRSDLNAAGLNPEEIEAMISDTDKLKQKISELNKAIESSGGKPELRANLVMMRDSYQSLLDSVKEGETVTPKMIAGLDVTEIVNTRERVKELDQQIEELKDLLQYSPNNADLVSRLQQLVLLRNQMGPLAQSVQGPSYTNPWEQKYKEEWQGGNAHQRIGFAADAAGTVANAANSAGNLIARIPGLEDAGNAVGEVTSTIMDVIGVIQGVSAVIEMINGVGLATQAASISANTGALVANTLAVGSMARTMALNSAFSFLPFFSDGGMVGGSSWTGDKLLARVNSGEMVLNANQQKNLLAGLNNAESVGSQSLVGSRAVVRGEDIYVTLNNYMRRSGKKL